MNKTLNKSEFIEALSGRLGDSKTSAAALDAVVGEIERSVSAGDKVNITGFGVFEPRERAARTGRNPRTGEPIKVAKSTVPAFRPGAAFKSMVSGNAGSRSAYSSSQSKGNSQPSGRASSQSSQSSHRRATAKATTPQASARRGPQAMSRAKASKSGGQGRMR